MSTAISNLQSWLKEQDMQAAMLTSPDTVFYLSGFRTNPHERLLALLVFQEAEPFLVCPKMEVEAARNAGWNFEIISYTDIENPWESIYSSVSKRAINIQKLAVEKEHLNVERFEKVNKLFSSPKLFAAEEKLRQLRMVKNDKEIELIREACKIADFAVEAGVAEISEGKTEMEILAAIEFELKKTGINEMAFSTMVLTGANAASPHGTPGITKIKKGDLVLFDLGVVYNGYCSDITRTVAYGGVSDKQAEIYRTVLKAQEAAASATKPGISCSELDLTARRIITEQGYGEYFPHRLGHGLGTSVHEYPSLTETNLLKLQEGMVFTIEPGIYVPGLAGVRIEDDILVTSDGFEALTKYPKTLQII
ncbi:aminopeptidase P family protein [Peribacillus saganii]|uniref:Aminopeptidase P family protein n=1 Tax=Peribacillus saganii TaxID=2303992 RepID=A0A372LRR6_9BACI|nr:Xaa-Pro peptidase family protein [Peribacillus saganii]RFU70756.1 aminopeptidase P family protein [Peribacillus saganii]